MYKEGFNLEEREKHIHQLTENFTEIEEKLNNRKFVIPLRIAEGSGNSTTSGWNSRLSIQTRMPDYLGIGEKAIRKAEFCAVIGLKASAGAVVKGKVRFSFKDGSYVEGVERTATTDWQYWSELLQVDKGKLLDVEPPINAIQQYMMVYLDSGTAYYYAGASSLLIYLN